MSIRFKSVRINKNKKPILSSVSFDINDGEIVFIKGTDGDVILDIISGALKISSGSVTISGYDIESMKAVERTKFFRNTVSTLDGYFLQPNLTIKDNLSLPGLFSGMSKKERISRIKNISKKFGISRILKKKPTKLSAEQIEKVCVARTIFMNPKVILAIEPSEWALNAFSGYVEDKSAILILLGDNSKLEKRATRIFAVDNGKIMEDKK